MTKKKKEETERLVVWSQLHSRIFIFLLWTRTPVTKRSAARFNQANHNVGDVVSSKTLSKRKKKIKRKMNSRALPSAKRLEKNLPQFFEILKRHCPPLNHENKSPIQHCPFFDTHGFRKLSKLFNSYKHISHEPFFIPFFFSFASQGQTALLSHDGVHKSLKTSYKKKVFKVGWARAR